MTRILFLSSHPLVFSTILSFLSFFNTFVIFFNYFVAIFTTIFLYFYYYFFILYYIILYYIILYYIILYYIILYYIILYYIILYYIIFDERRYFMKAEYRACSSIWLFMLVMWVVWLETPTLYIRLPTYFWIAMGFIAGFFVNGYWLTYKLLTEYPISPLFPLLASLL